MNKPIIKVITGMRRSGKSVLMAQIQEYLRREGTDEKNIIAFNFESMSIGHLRSSQALYDYVGGLIKERQGNKVYLFFDEVQEVDQWERAINSFLVDFDCDIYISGSNAKLLSSELSTLIAGRYVAFEVLPLSFSEFVQMRQISDMGAPRAKGQESEEILQTDGLQPSEHGLQSSGGRQSLFDLYVRFGGLPGLHMFPLNKDVSDQYLRGIYATILLKDIVQRHHIRDAELLERIVLYVSEQVGNTFSARSISRFLKNQGRSISAETVYNYLNGLTDAYLVHRVSRYDLRGKGILETQEKFYMNDLGLRNCLMEFQNRDISGLLENIVYLELKRRGYTLYVGKYDEREVDFVAIRHSEITYFQVCLTLAGERTVEREFAPLRMIPDHHPRFVLSMDPMWKENLDGIRWRNIMDFLLDM